MAQSEDRRVVGTDFGTLSGLVHTHSSYATAWAARGEPIPCVLTAIADEFGGDIPLRPFARIGGEEIGQGIVQMLDGSRSRAVLMRRPRPVHDRSRCARGGQGRRHVRGRRAHRGAGRGASAGSSVWTRTT
jgi:Class II Aldolase and Adducin N-terminal domain